MYCSLSSTRARRRAEQRRKDRVNSEGVEVGVDEGPLPVFPMCCLAAFVLRQLDRFCLDALRKYVRRRFAVKKWS